MSSCRAAYSHTGVFTLFMLVRYACSNVADAGVVQAIKVHTTRGLHWFALSYMLSGFFFVNARIFRIHVAVSGAAQVSLFQYSPGEIVAGWFSASMGRSCAQLEINGNGTCWILVHAQSRSFIVIVVIVLLHERVNCTTRQNMRWP